MHGAVAVDEEVTVLLDGHWGDPADHGDELFSTEVSSLVKIVGQSFTRAPLEMSIRAIQGRSMKNWLRARKYPSVRMSRTAPIWPKRMAFQAV